MSKKGRPTQLRAEILKLLKDERLSIGQRVKFVNMLANIDGYVDNRAISEMPNEEDIFAQDSEARIAAALKKSNVKGESHASSDTSS